MSRSEGRLLTALLILGLATGPALAALDDEPPVLCWQRVDPERHPGLVEGAPPRLGAELLATVAGHRHVRLEPSGGREVVVRSANPHLFVFAPTHFEIRPDQALGEDRTLWISARDGGVGVREMRVREVPTPTGVRALRIEATDLLDNVVQLTVPSAEPALEVTPGRYCTGKLPRTEIGVRLAGSVLVPEIRGLRPAEAEEALAAADLRMALLAEPGEVPGAIAKIVHQDPNADAEVRAGTTVEVRAGLFGRVPDVVGRRTDEARETVDRLGYELSEGEPVSDLPTRIGYQVVAQSPEPGEELLLGEAIHASIAPLVYVPSLQDLELETAKLAAETERLALTSVETGPELPDSITRVAGQHPDPGSAVPVASPIVVDLIRLVRVPDLAGLDPEAARALLSSRRLRMRTDTAIAGGPTTTEWEVTAQAPDAGREVAPGSAVSAFFSGLIRVPELRGKPLEEATESLEELGLAVGALGWRESPIEESGVVVQEIRAGRRVPAGTAVALALAKPAPQTSITWPWPWLLALALLLLAWRLLRRAGAEFRVEAEADLEGLRQSAHGEGSDREGAQIDIRLRPVFDAGWQTLAESGTE